MLLWTIASRHHEVRHVFTPPLHHLPQRALRRLIVAILSILPIDVRSVVLAVFRICVHLRNLRIPISPPPLDYVRLLRYNTPAFPDSSTVERAAVNR